jgi:NNP family nitrate/nitrite transporter-like MFS transporter
LAVDAQQDDKAKEIQLCGFSRPHMRAFHCSWYVYESMLESLGEDADSHLTCASFWLIKKKRWGFFIAFFIWFAISPLLPEIKDSLGLSKKEIWTSSIAGVGGTILIRFILGPLCDKYGARVLFSLVLCGASIPTACTGFIHTAQELVILRAFIGLAGGTFVMCQYWTSRMFTAEVVGTANALVGGWGNLGASVTQIVMGSFLFPVFESAVIAFTTGVIIFFISDDAPKGNYRELRKNDAMCEVSVFESFSTVCMDWNTWLLFIQYACCFGVELTMNNAAALYFRVRDIFMGLGGCGNKGCSLNL